MSGRSSCFVILTVYVILTAYAILTKFVILNSFQDNPHRKPQIVILN